MNSFYDESLLVFDEPLPSLALPKHFRSTRVKELKQLNHRFPELNLTGFCDLNISISGQFSCSQLLSIVNSLPQSKYQIWIIDLRQESHGFIDGDPISWYGPGNAANQGLSAFAIQAKECYLLNTLAKKQPFLVHHILQKTSGNITSSVPSTVTAKNFLTEKMVVEALGLKYQRFYALDHAPVAAAEVTRFIQFVQALPKHSWLHFHCRAGKGRSSQFLVMYDMLCHHRLLCWDELMARQGAFNPVNFLEVSYHPAKLWKAAYARQKLCFLKAFYAYLQDPNGLAVTPWSIWLKTQCTLD